MNYFIYPVSEGSLWICSKDTKKVYSKAIAIEQNKPMTLEELISRLEELKKEAEK